VIDPAGRLTPINLAGLRELIGQHLRGSGGEKRRRVAARVFRIPVRHTAAP
jgi:hypothetical protein